MTNLYVRLVKHGKKDEDFRTEALADLLERLLSKDREENIGRFQEFVSEVLLAKPTDQKACFLDMLDNSLADLSIKTQHQIPQGRIPDIVIFNRGRPICVVEVKVAAEIRGGQLEDYDAFLEAKAGGNPTALVLLTHITPPPEGFIDPGCNRYRVGLRSVASWNNTAEWFEKLSHGENGVDEPLKTLADEFRNFLKEYDMPMLDDVAKARLYLADSHDALTGAVKNMGDGNTFTNGWSKSELKYEPGGISRWHNQGDRGIGYGLCFKPLIDDRGGFYGCRRYENDALNYPTAVNIEDGSYAYVYVFAPPAQCQKIPGYSNNQWYERNEAGEVTPAENGPHVDSTGWWYYNQRGEAYYATFCPIQELLDGDGRIGNELQKWAHEVLGDAVKLYEAL